MPMFSVCPLFFEGLVLFCYSTTTVYSFTQCIEAVGRTYVIFDIVVVVVLLLVRVYVCACVRACVRASEPVIRRYQTGNSFLLFQHKNVAVDLRKRL